MLYGSGEVLVVVFVWWCEVECEWLLVIVVEVMLCYVYYLFMV